MDEALTAQGKNLNLNPKHPCQKTSMVMHAQNPAWWVETGDFQKPPGLSVYLIGHLQVWWEILYQN